MSNSIPHFINGNHVHEGTLELPIFNPANGIQISSALSADEIGVTHAVQSSLHAFQSWQHTSLTERVKILFQFRNLVEQSKSALAKIIVSEHGKTTQEALGSIQRGLEVLEYACNIPNHLKGYHSKQVGKGVDCYSFYQPVGVCVGITPFNFPAMIPLWMLSMAVACGNTFILKPSEKDPSCALKLVELIHEAGLPTGVVNLLNGNDKTVRALLTHHDVDAVSFVGSSAVAKIVQETAIQHGKRVQAFGGAKNHCLVMPDANLNEVAQALSIAAYDCAGERCMAISVVLVMDDMADELINQLKLLIANIKIGPGDDPTVTMGPLITEAHRDRVLNYIELGCSEGAELVIDGRKTKVPDKGFFLGASLFDKVEPSMRIYQEEIFGPVLCIVRVNDFDQAITLINQHAYGNGTAIFTNNGYYAREFSNRVKVGMVGINVPVPVPVAYHAFGGWKQSVFADIGMYGFEGVRFYTRLKTVTERWRSGENAWKL